MTGDKKRGGFLSNFIEVDTGSSKKKSAAPAQVSPAPAFFSQPSEPAAATAPVGQTQMSSENLDKFINHFEKLMKDANLPGPDYYEFAKVMGTLKAHIHDERELMLAALGSLQAQLPEGRSPITKDILLSSAQHYAGIIQQDKQEFMKTSGRKKEIRNGNQD